MIDRNGNQIVKMMSLSYSELKETKKSVMYFKSSLIVLLLSNCLKYLVLGSYYYLFSNIYATCTNSLRHFNSMQFFHYFSYCAVCNRRTNN